MIRSAPGWHNGPVVLSRSNTRPSSREHLYTAGTWTYYFVCCVAGVFVSDSTIRDVICTLDAVRVAKSSLETLEHVACVTASKMETWLCRDTRIWLWAADARPDETARVLSCP